MSILFGLFETLPVLVIVVSGLRKMLFSTIRDKCCLLLMKQELMKSQNIAPISKSRQDIKFVNRGKGLEKSKSVNSLI